MSEASNAKEISLGDGFGEVAVKANGIRIELHADGSVDAYTTGQVNVDPAAKDTAAKAETLKLLEDRERELAQGQSVDPDASSLPRSQIGAIENIGEHKGEIYGGIYPADNKPIWFSAVPKLMDHDAAAAWAKKQGGSLPTRKQGDYLTTLKGKGGAFTEIFNRGNSFPAGYVWLAEPDTSYRYGAWCQRLSDGNQYDDGGRGYELPVLSVFR